MNKPTWRDRFDDEITSHKWVFENPETIDKTLDYVKSFIESELSQQRKEIINTIESMYKEQFVAVTNGGNFTEVRHKTIADIITKLSSEEVC